MMCTKTCNLISRQKTTVRRHFPSTPSFVIHFKYPYDYVVTYWDILVYEQELQDLNEDSRSFSLSFAFVRQYPARHFPL